MKRKATTTEAEGGEPVPVPEEGQWVGYIFKDGREEKRFFGRVIWCADVVGGAFKALVDFNDPKEKVPLLTTFALSDWRKTSKCGWDICAETDAVSCGVDEDYTAYVRKDQPMVAAGVSCSMPEQSTVMARADPEREAEAEPEREAEPELELEPELEPEAEPVPPNNSLRMVVEGLQEDEGFRDWIVGLIDGRVPRAVMAAMGAPVNLEKRLVVREDGKNAPCAWQSVLLGGTHTGTGMACHFVPMELFGWPTFKDAHPDASAAMTATRRYAVCAACRSLPTEKSKLFMDSKKRGGLCAICKGYTSVSAAANASKLALCENCKVSTMDGKIDKDREKRFLVRLLEPLKDLFPSVDFEVYPEFVVHVAKEGPGNHNKRIDCLVVMRMREVLGGHGRERVVSVLIELDYGQKRFAGEAGDREMETLKLKVQKVRKVFSPRVLVVWRVNLTGEYDVLGFARDTNLDLYERAVVMRMWMIYLVYHYEELPLMSVWYMWYNASKLAAFRTMFGGPEEAPYIHHVHTAPHAANHSWKFCVDPVEGGCDFYKKDERGATVACAENNPFRHRVVAHRLLPVHVFGMWPVGREGKQRVLGKLS